LDNNSTWNIDNNTPMTIEDTKNSMTRLSIDITRNIEWESDHLNMLNPHVASTTISVWEQREGKQNYYQYTTMNYI